MGCTSLSAPFQPPPSYHSEPSFYFLNKAELKVRLKEKRFKNRKRVDLALQAASGGLESRFYIGRGCRHCPFYPLENEGRRLAGKPPGPLAAACLLCNLEQVTPCWPSVSSSGKMGRMMGLCSHLQKPLQLWLYQGAQGPLGPRKGWETRATPLQRGCRVFKPLHT